MSSLPQESPRRWRAASLLGFVTFLSFIYFYEGGGWNQNSRFDLLRAIIERHTLQIDNYHDNTQDKAHFRGHYYSDKAPGLVFLAVPFAIAARPLLRISGFDPDSPRGVLALSFLVSAGSVALPAAFAVIALFFFGLRFGCDFTAAAFGALVMGLATPFWAYAGLFWAHALVGSCLVFGFGGALKLRDNLAPGGDILWSLAVGFAAGWATVTEYPAALASAILAIFAMSRAWPRGSAARWRVVVGLAFGAGACLVVFLTYLYAAFGSFRPSYAYYDPNSFSFMQQRGYFGLTYPHPDRLLKLLFGCSRGLFFASPVAMAAPVGLWWMWKEKEHRAEAAVVATITAYYFLFNASFYWWKSGLSFGPRYAGASIPLMCLGLEVVWQHSPRIWRVVLTGLAVLSALSALMVVSTTSQLSMQDSCPLIHSTWPAFWSGHMAMNRGSMLTVAEAGTTGRYGAFNLGQLMGLHGLATLTPLIAMWIVAGLLWLRITRSNHAPEKPASSV